MRVPPSQSATMVGSRRQRLVAMLDASALLTRVSRVPIVNVSMRSADVCERVGEAQMGLGALLHRAGHVDQEQDAALARAPAQPRQAHHLAVVPDGFAQAAAQVGRAAAPVERICDSRAGAAAARARRAGTGAGSRFRSRHRSGARSSISALAAACPDSRVWSVTGWIEACRGRPRGRASRRPRPPRALSVIVGLAEKMRIEQGIEFHAPLGRRGRASHGRRAGYR